LATLGYSDVHETLCTHLQPPPTSDVVLVGLIAPTGGSRFCTRPLTAVSLAVAIVRSLQVLVNAVVRRHERQYSLMEDHYSLIVIYLTFHAAFKTVSYK